MNITKEYDMYKKATIGGKALALSAFLLFGLAPAHAEGMKIGYVDMKSAVENTRDHQEGMKKLQALQDQKIKELTVLREQIAAAEKELLSQSMAMAPDRLAMKQQALQDMQKRFQRQQQDAQEEVGAEKNRLEMSIGAKFQRVMQDYGKQHGYDFIMPKPMFLYIDPKHDVTGDITKLLDAK